MLTSRRTRTPHQCEPRQDLRIKTPLPWGRSPVPSDRSRCQRRARPRTGSWTSAALTSVPAARVSVCAGNGNPALAAAASWLISTESRLKSMSA
jgi:hypothetical protein